MTPARIAEIEEYLATRGLHNPIAHELLAALKEAQRVEPTDAEIEAVANAMNLRAVQMPYDLRNHTPKVFYLELAKAALIAAAKVRGDA